MAQTIEQRISNLRARINNQKKAFRHKVKKQAFRFKPFSEKQKQVLTWWCPDSTVKDADGIIADGAIRSGKTLSMSLSYVLWAMNSFNQQNFGMAGKTIGSFRRNVLFWLKLMLASRGYKVADHRSDNLLVISKGDTVNYFYIFGGKDERSQDLIQGITLAGMFFDEVALMPESFVNQCEKKNLLYLHFTMDDNLSLSEKIKNRYRGMYVGVFFKRYILGLWCVAEGLVYSMFDPEKHVTSEHMTGAKEYIVSVDYGTVNPFSCGLWAFDGKNSIREQEVYYNSREVGRRVDDEEYYRMMDEMIGNRRVSYIIVDPSAASFIEVIKKHGKYIVKGANNDVLDGIRVVTTFLNKGMIKIHESCEDCISEFGLYCWDEESTEDAVIKENDHAMDDVRYYCYTFLRQRLRWKY